MNDEKFITVQQLKQDFIIELACRTTRSAADIKELVELIDWQLELEIFADAEITRSTLLWGEK